MPIKMQKSVRLIGIVPPEAESKAVVAFEDVRDSVTRNTGLNVTGINWFSTYRVHHRVADSFRAGRVFLAGDAGHIHSPVGGQGMNTGIGDAINLAWKLAEVLKGRLPSQLLESYNPERHAFAQTLVRTTDRVFKIVSTRTYIGSWIRVHIFPNVFAFASRFQKILKFLFRTVSQTRIHYRESILSEGVAGDIYAGDRLPWIRYSQGDNYEMLNSLSWQIHVYGDVSPALKSNIRHIPIYELEWNKDAEEKGLIKNAMYVIRPDGYIAFASETQNAVMALDYLRTISFQEL